MDHHRARDPGPVGGHRDNFLFAHQVRIGRDPARAGSQSAHRDRGRQRTGRLTADRGHPPADHQPARIDRADSEERSLRRAAANRAVVGDRRGNARCHHHEPADGGFGRAEQRSDHLRPPCLHL